MATRFGVPSGKYIILQNFLLLSAILAPGIMLGNGAPNDIVAFFHDSPAGCPTGWQEFVPGQGRLVVGVAQGTERGMVVGTPLTNMEVRHHGHFYSASVNIKKKGLAATSGSNESGAQEKNLEIPLAATGPELNMPSDLPFVQLVLCKKGPVVLGDTQSNDNKVKESK